MQEVFEKILERLEEIKERDLCKGLLCKDCKSRYTECRNCDMRQQSLAVDRCKEIVKQAAAEYNSGHFGCNTNGEHEKCNGCGLTNCKNRNKIWFGVSDDNNGWIPCSEKLPDDFMSFEYLTIRKGHTLATITYYCVANHKWYLSRNSSKEIEVIAWQPLPKPYTKGE